LNFEKHGQLRQRQLPQNDPGALPDGPARLLLLFSFRSIEIQIASDRWDHDAQASLAELGATLSILKDAETGQRGYLLTGDEKYLEPYQRALPLIDEHLDRLDELVSGSPFHKERIAVLRRLITFKVQELEQTVGLRRRDGLESALRVVRTGTGKEAMDDVRTLMAEMGAEEDRRLALLRTIRYGISAFSLAAIIVAVIFHRGRSFGHRRRPGRA
jgi:CHASE3 domain sensor protein